MNRNVLPGQRIVLSFDCNEFQIQSIQWTIPGSKFSSYVLAPGNTSAQLNELPASALTQKTVTFYWADSGMGRTISVTFKIHGKECRKTAIINVITPVSELTWVSFGTTKISSNNLFIGLFTATGGPPGADMNGKVSAPVQPDGIWAFLQTVRPTGVYQKEADDSCKKLNQNDITCLDGSFPYTATPEVPVGFPWSFNDTPQMPFNQLKAMKGEFRFNLYVMYRPTLQDSQWVPLKRAFWKYWYCGTKANGQWTFSNKGEQNDNADIPSSHPIWSQIIDPNSFTNAPCPSPFCP